MSKVDKLGVKLFTYDKQDGSSTNQVTFEALLYYPSGSVNIQSSEDLMRTAASAQDQNTVKKVAYVIQNKDLSRRIDSTSESDTGLLTTTIKSESTIGPRVLSTSSYLNVRPFSPTSVSSLASNKLRSRSRPHW
jgi:hypothetical protein